MAQTNTKAVIFCLPNYYGSCKAKGAIKCPEINPNISVQLIFDKGSDSIGKKVSSTNSAEGIPWCASGWDTLLSLQ